MIQYSSIEKEVNKRVAKEMWGQIFIFEKKIYIFNAIILVRGV